MHVLPAVISAPPISGLWWENGQAPRQSESRVLLYHLTRPAIHYLSKPFFFWFGIVAPNGSTALVKALATTALYLGLATTVAVTAKVPVLSPLSPPPTKTTSDTLSKRSSTPMRNEPAGSFGLGRRRARPNGTCRNCWPMDSFRSL